MSTLYQPTHRSGLTGPKFGSYIEAALWLLDQPALSGWTVELVSQQAA